MLSVQSIIVSDATQTENANSVSKDTMHKMVNAYLAQSKAAKIVITLLISAMPAWQDSFIM
jgi:hypothetical protein